jgi:lipoprotein-releasing system permease protein
MSQGGIVRVFFVQGAMIGWIGVAIGVALGIVLGLYAPQIVAFFEQLLGAQIMPGDVYYVTRIPSELEWQDVTVIAVLAFVLTSVATLYPARRAALVDPAAALRYE